MRREFEGVLCTFEVTEKNRHGSTLKPGSQKGSRDNVPCRVQGQRPCWGLGQRPNRSSSDQFQGSRQQGAGSEASLPVTSRVRRRASKLLFPTSVLCRARWARPCSWSCDQSCSFPQAGISRLRARPEGFAVALWTASHALPCYLILIVAEGFRLCGGDQGAFRSPFGNLRRRNFWGYLRLNTISR